MHEVGLCEDVLDAVLRRADGRRVTGVRVRVGVLHHVSDASFEQAFQVVSDRHRRGGRDRRPRPCARPRPLPRLLGRDRSPASSSSSARRASASDLEVVAGDELLLESIALAARGWWPEGAVMCLGIPGEVVAILIPATSSRPSTSPAYAAPCTSACSTVRAIEPGDWVLIHVGFALSKIDEAEATRGARVPREHRHGLRRGDPRRCRSRCSVVSPSADGPRQP